MHFVLQVSKIFGSGYQEVYIQARISFFLFFLTVFYCTPLLKISSGRALREYQFSRIRDHQVFFRLRGRRTKFKIHLFLRCSPIPDNHFSLLRIAICSQLRELTSSQAELMVSILPKIRLTIYFDLSWVFSRTWIIFYLKHLFWVLMI